MINYTKLKSGSWGLRGDAAALTPGAQVVVTKKDGATKGEHVGRVIWTDGKVSISSIRRNDHVTPPNAAQSEDGAARAGHAAPRIRSCVTGGNCSSVNSGRACGGFDCDGW